MNYFSTMGIVVKEMIIMIPRGLHTYREKMILALQRRSRHFSGTN
jgi:hypothetical protein